MPNNPNPPSPDNPIKVFYEKLNALENSLRESKKDPNILLLKFAELKAALREALNRIGQNAAQERDEFWTEKNKTLVDKFEKIRGELEKMRLKMDNLMTAPCMWGVFSDFDEQGTANVYVNGRKMKVHIFLEIPEEDKKRLVKGCSVLLNDFNVLVGVRGFEKSGEVATVDAVLDDDRVQIITRHDEKTIAQRGELLIGVKLHLGDFLLYDSRSGHVLEQLPKQEIRELYLEEVPDVTYDHIGGLKNQLHSIRKAIEWPLLHPKLYKLFKRGMPKGVLLYGPPGCGKTLIAKAVARSIADRMSKEFGKDVKAFFLNIKGPELLTKWVGESERKIREIFQKAREKATEHNPVVIFFDEAESVFRTRGTGISSDVESTIVPQLLSELDGVEKLKNVIVMFASNRQDLIDPAILRPERTSVKIKVDRPDKDGAKEIFQKYVTADLPIHPKYTNKNHSKFNSDYEKFDGNPETIITYIIERATKRLWATKEEPYTYRVDGIDTPVDNSIMEITTNDGQKITLYLKDLASGAMIKSIVERAKENAIERILHNDPDQGLMTADFCRAVEQEMDENEELPNTRKDADEWLAMQGRHESVAGVKSLLMERRKKTGPEKKIETVTTGHYL